ncbi:glycoside hydrolase family 43 protein [Bifidobacterium sp. H1HS10N]|uniref:glycoside hydrolase family 43 protein n=1 Tax=Bifidobacterium kimbladii TaxID=1293826 RepID=UPI0028BEC8FC|nr:glycoside hydrolase family 43 protein [Bifidobacterium sp. H1HS10N]MDT7512484.1 glycoside hydrolase family 43 protein [Bifidobacterium sp. H1HS10N]
MSMDWQPSFEATSAYLFVHFTGHEQAETDEQLYFALSRDGLHWHDLRAQGDPVLTWSEGEGGVRDPYIVRGPDGLFHIIATDLSVYHRGGWQEGRSTVDGSTGLVIWDSPDLAHWGRPRLVDVASAIPKAGMAWAPEACWDADRGQWIVFWATAAADSAEDPSAADLANELGDGINMYYATSTDLVSFSRPVKWIDRSNGIIDTTMLKAPDGWWYRASKDDQITLERTRNPYAATYELVRTDDDQAWSYLSNLTDIFGQGRYSSRYLEGPELFLYNDADAAGPDGRTMPFGLICDQFAEGRGYLPFRCADLSSRERQDWALVSDMNFGRLTKRHGSIMPITESEYRILKRTLTR